MATKTRVGIIGCGAISGIYCKNISGLFGNIEVVACADIIEQKAKERAAEYGIPRVLSPEALLADPDVDIVLNLTIPAAHGDICLSALQHGKHTYVEKPLSVERADGKKLVDEADARGLRLGCAPDTFLGGGLQTCRDIVDSGEIGEVVAAVAFMAGHGHESWHPSPEFYYKKGGGPVFDMGPYYLTALVSLIGPVAKVSGSAKVTFPERTITSEPLSGQIIKVEVPTHVTGILEFKGGCTATMVMSFDVWGAHLPRIELYGTKGSLSVPDPNTFKGPVMIKTPAETEWREVPVTRGYTENSRGVGVADMAAAVAEKRAHRANGNLAYHVLDVMHRLHESAEAGQFLALESECARPDALPAGFAF